MSLPVTFGALPFKLLQEFSVLFSKFHKMSKKRPKNVVRTAWLYQVRKYSSKRSQELKKHLGVQKTVRSILPSEDLLRASPIFIHSACLFKATKNGGAIIKYKYKYRYVISDTDSGH
jgi:hypothetical protein